MMQQLLSQQQQLQLETVHENRRLKEQIDKLDGYVKEDDTSAETANKDVSEQATTSPESQSKQEEPKPGWFKRLFGN